MKKYLLTTFILLFPLIAKCDFVDYWIISVNDSIIYDSRKDGVTIGGEYKIHSNFLNYLIVDDNDTLKINYITDTPCPNCKQHLIIIDENETELLRRSKLGFDNKLNNNDPLAFLTSTTKYGEFFLFKKDIDILKGKKKLAVYFHREGRTKYKKIMDLY